MRRKIFFWLEKLKISRTERHAISTLLIVLALLMLLNAAISPGSPFNEKYYQSIDERFHERTALMKQREQKMLARYEGDEAPELSPDTTVQDTTKQKQQAENDPININRADAQMLQRLNGIGATYAQRIIDYRRDNGPFQSGSDLLNVKGIGETRLQKIEARITFGDAGSDSAVSSTRRKQAPVNEQHEIKPQEKINVNKASAEMLQKLEGIGPTYSSRIVAYRRKNGPFKTKDELLKIKGIGKKRLAKIKPFIKLTGQK